MPFRASRRRSVVSPVLQYAAATKGHSINVYDIRDGASIVFASFGPSRNSSSRPRQLRLLPACTTPTSLRSSLHPKTNGAECSHPPLCYDFTDLDTYMNLPDVRSSLGVGTRPWAECATTPHMLLTNDWMQARAGGGSDSPPSALPPNPH